MLSYKFESRLIHLNWVRRKRNEDHSSYANIISTAMEKQGFSANSEVTEEDLGIVFIREKDNQKQRITIHHKTRNCLIILLSIKPIDDPEHITFSGRVAVLNSVQEAAEFIEGDLTREGIKKLLADKRGAR